MKERAKDAVAIGFLVFVFPLIFIYNRTHWRYTGHRNFLGGWLASHGGLGADLVQASEWVAAGLTAVALLGVAYERAKDRLA